MTVPQPKITIITVVRNASGELKKTIGSVLTQDYPHLEFILVDGGSTDGTVEVIREHSAQIAWWVSEPDRGIYDAMNKGLAKATGEWVNFMNAGDIFYSNDVISSVFSNKLDGFAVVYGDSIAAYPKALVPKPAGTPEQMVTGMVFCHQATFVRRDLIGSVGFDLKYAIGADFNILFSLYAQGALFKKLPILIAVFDASGLSNLKMVQSAREHFAIVKKYRKLTFQERIYHYRFICWVSMVSMGYMVLPEGVVHWMRGKMSR